MSCESQTVQVQSTSELVCPKCNLQLARRFDMRRHMLTHSKNVESLKYHCPFEGCTTSCLQKGNLVTHMKRHSGLKDIKCPHDGCNWSTGDPAALTRHRKTQHGYTPAPRAPRGKATKPAKAQRYKPYYRVPYATELKIDLKVEEVASSPSPPSTISSTASAVASSPEPTACVCSGLPLKSSQFELQFPSYSVDTVDPFGMLLPQEMYALQFGIPQDATPSPQYVEVQGSSSHSSVNSLPELLAAFNATSPDLMTLGSYDNAFSIATGSTSTSSAEVPLSHPSTHLINVWNASNGEWANTFSVPSPADSDFSEPLTPAANIPGPDTTFFPSLAVTGSYSSPSPSDYLFDLEISHNL